MIEKLSGNRPESDDVTLERAVSNNQRPKNCRFERVLTWLHRVRGWRNDTSVPYTTYAIGWTGVHVHPHDPEVRVNVCRRYNLVLVLPSVYLNRKARTAPRTLAVRSKRAECRVQEFQPVSIQRTCGLSFNSCSNRSANVSTSGSGRPVHTREKLS